METDAVFDRVCQALNALRPVDIPDPSHPFAVVYDGTPVAWFEDFQAASIYARTHFMPDTYAIGDPSAGPDFLPMFFVRQPFA
jgi:hypothetical protein